MPGGQLHEESQVKWVHFLLPMLIPGQRGSRLSKDTLTSFSPATQAFPSPRVSSQWDSPNTPHLEGMEEAF